MPIIITTKPWMKTEKKKIRGKERERQRERGDMREISEGDRER